MAVTTAQKRKGILASAAVAVVALSGFIGHVAAPSSETKTVTQTVTVPVLPKAAAAAIVATWPTPATTGVPAGTALADTPGTTIRSCGVYDAKHFTGDVTILASNGTHSESTPCVTLKRTRVSGIIDDKWSSYSCAGFQGCGPVLLLDSEVANPRTADVAAVSDSNIFMRRSYVHGARSGVQCDGNCYLFDNVLVADRESGTAHMDGFITNGNYGAPMVVDHNSILCDSTLGDSVPNGAGCAADAGLFGDFSDVSQLTFTNNLIRSTTSAYFCFDTPYLSGKPHPNGGSNRITGNRWESGSSGKCGGAGPVNGGEGAITKNGNLWCDNVWLDGANAGKPVLPGLADNCGSTPPSTVTTTTVPQPSTSLSTPSSVPAPTTTASTTSTTRPTSTTTRPPATTTTVPSTPTTQCLTAPRPRVCTVAGT